MDYIIDGNYFVVIDTLEYITLADSFVKNKIGTGHGEAKLYVGNESKRINQFFEGYSCNCFFRKTDFVEFLEDAASEYLFPQQNYVNKADLPVKYKSLKQLINQYNQEILPFSIYRVNVEPPRVYVNSNSSYYDFMRTIGLPNISYLSILKLKNQRNEVCFYFKMFIDYKSDPMSYVMKDEKEQESRILNDTTLSPRTREALIHARIGQGDYRKRLLEECSLCPFTLVDDERLLIASHIKPWVFSNDQEKMDVKNGFVLTPTFDRLFDRGFISFEDDKTLVVSPWLSPMNQKRLGIYTGKLIEKLPLDNKRSKYLEFHRNYIFKH